MATNTRDRIGQVSTLQKNPRLNHPAVLIYDLISTWLDTLIAEGKLTENPDNRVTRWDIGQLNYLIDRAYKAANPTLEPGSTSSLDWLPELARERTQDPEQYLVNLARLIEREIQTNAQVRAAIKGMKEG